MPVYVRVRLALVAAAVGPHAHGPRAARGDRDDLPLPVAARTPPYRDAGDAVAEHPLDALPIDVHGHAHDPPAPRLVDAVGEPALVLAASLRRLRGGAAADRLRERAAELGARGGILLQRRRKGEVARGVH